MLTIVLIQLYGCSTLVVKFWTKIIRNYFTFFFQINAKKTQPSSKDTQSSFNKRLCDTHVVRCAATLNKMIDTSSHAVSELHALEDVANISARNLCRLNQNVDQISLSLCMSMCNSKPLAVWVILSRACDSFVGNSIKCWNHWKNKIEKPYYWYHIGNNIHYVHYIVYYLFARFSAQRGL